MIIVRSLAFIFGMVVVSVLTMAAQGEDNSSADFLNEAAQKTVRIHVTGTPGGGIAINNWGTGVFISADGRILTAAHVFGRPFPFRTDLPEGPSSNEPKIEIEMPDSHGVLQRMDNADPKLLKIDTDLDIAVIKVAGFSYPFPTCSEAEVGDSTKVKGLGWEKGKAVPDRLIEGEITPTNPSDGDRYTVIHSGAFEGNSGGPVYDDRKQLIGIITSGRDGRLTPGPSQYFATPIQRARPLVGGVNHCFSRFGTPQSREEIQRLAQEQECKRQKTAELESRVDTVAVEGSVQCQGGGFQGRGERENQPLTVDVKMNYVLVGQPVVQTKSSNNGWHDGPFQFSDPHTGQVIRVSITMHCRSPDQLFGPGAWHDVTLVTRQRALITQADRVQIQQACSQ